MKRCPRCRRDYYDDSLLYCLDDGTALLDGPRSGEEPTANFSEASTVLDADRIATRRLGSKEDRDAEPGTDTPSSRRSRSLFPAVALGIVLVAAVSLAAVYWVKSQPAPEKKAVSQAAYDDYMRAKVLVGRQNKDDNQAGIKLLEEAVNQEPQYAAAWAMLAQFYSVRAFYFAAATDERKQLNDNAQVSVAKALAIDPNLADAHLARGELLWTHDSRFQHESAVQAYKRAIELDPKLDEAHHQLALVYFHVGLFDKAEAEIAKALELNPANSLARYRYAVIDMYRGKYDDAYSISQSTPLAQAPSLQASQGAMILFRLGRIDEAERTVDAYLSKYPRDEGGISTSVKAMILAKRGRADDALAAILRAEELGQEFGHFHHTAYNIACVYVMLGKPDKAVDYLQLAADDGFPCYPLFERDELLKGLSHDPRFIALLARLKQQWDRYNTTL